MKKVILSKECPWNSVLTVTMSENRNARYPIEVNGCLMDTKDAIELAYTLLEAAEVNPPKIEPRKGGTARLGKENSPVRDIWGIAPNGAVWLESNDGAGQSYTKAKFSDEWEVLS